MLNFPYLILDILDRTFWRYKTLSLVKTSKFYIFLMFSHSRWIDLNSKTSYILNIIVLTFRLQIRRLSWYFIEMFLQLALCWFDNSCPIFNLDISLIQEYSILTSCIFDFIINIFQINIYNIILLTMEEEHYQKR